MATAVITVASGGLPVVDVTATTPKLGLPVTEAVAVATVKYGIPITKVTAPAPGLAVTFVTAVLALVSSTWDPATITNVTLSGGNLVATNTSSATNQGARVAAAKNTGKFYFEMAMTTTPGGGACSVGVGPLASIYSTLNGNGTTGAMLQTDGTGTVFSDGTNTGITFGARSAGDTIGIAVDLDNRKAWFRIAAAGNWNNNASFNPATNVGGVTVPAGSMAPYAGFAFVSGYVFTANFGASAFAGIVPAGYVSGWPV